MAWAERQRSGRYAGKYRDAAGNTRSLGKTFTNKAEAKRQAGDKEVEARRRPGEIDLKAGKLTWGTWADQWWPRRAVEKNTDRTDRGRLRNHVRPRWGEVPLEAIRRDAVQEWVLDLTGSGLAASTVISCYGILSSSLRTAVIEGRLDTSPCEAIRLPHPPEGEERFLTHAEVDRIAAVLAEPFRTLFLTLVGTGLRWGELAGLHWHRVDLAAGHLDVIETFDVGQREIKPYPKSKRRRRVWLAPWLVDELRRHRDTHPPTARCQTKHRQDSRCRSGLVFTGGHGAVVSYSNFHQRHWGRAVGRNVFRVPGDPQPDRVFPNPSEARRVAGFRNAALVHEWQEGLAEVGRVRIHDCRHTFASWLVQAGVPIYDVAEQLGHSSATVTARYGHLAGASRERVTTALAWPVDTGPATQTPRTPDISDGVVIDSAARFRR